MVVREDVQRSCSNGNNIETYPESYRGCQRIGINGRGKVEYADVEHGVVYEIQFGVRTDDIMWNKTHGMLGDTVDEHIESSAARFGEWWYTETE